MTSIYFVRHAQRTKQWDDDFSCPLTNDGLEDSHKVVDILRRIKIDAFISSPYKRCIDTIKPSADLHSFEIETDIRFRERKCGINGNNFEMFRKRWNDLDYYEVDGESLNMVQKRNIEALNDVLINYSGKNVVIGTHGTALSTILNYYDDSFGCDDFIKIIDYMPYIIRLDFDELECVGKEEVFFVYKQFKDNK